MRECGAWQSGGLFVGQVVGNANQELLVQHNVLRERIGDCVLERSPPQKMKEPLNELSSSSTATGTVAWSYVRMRQREFGVRRCLTALRTIASFVPAWRAARVEPVQILRQK